MNITQKLNHCFALLLVVILLGCAAPATPTLLPASDSAPALEPTLFPTLLASATETVMPTTMPEAPLRTAGPYFSYFRQVNGEYHFVMMDADGVGRKVITLPAEIIDASPFVEALLNVQYVSPDGKWLVFYTGSSGEFGALPEAGVFDLTLNMLNLETEEITVITSLLSEDYPNNFKEAARQLNDTNITDVDLYSAFVSGIRSAVWSPDGHYLAFAGQMDGLSSDLYLYDLDTKIIRRLSRGDQEIQSIEWSPGGKWILYSSTYEIGTDMEFDIYVASIDGSSIKHLSTASSDFRIWSSQNTYIEHDNENVIGNFGLRLVDVNTGQIKKIWDGPVSLYDLNFEQSKLVFATHLFSHSPKLSIEPDPNFVSSLYLIDLNTFVLTNVKLPPDYNISGYFADTFTIKEDLFVLIGSGYAQMPFLLSDTGEITQVHIDGIEWITGSPDSRYWVAVTNKTAEVYSSDNEFIVSIPLPFQESRSAFFTWNPDSSGLFIVKDENVYYLDISTGNIMLLDSNLLKPLFSVGYRWIIER